MGVHPTHCGDFAAHAGGPDVLLAELRALLEDGCRDGKVVAVGEVGLDYDRHGLATILVCSSFVWDRAGVQHYAGKHSCKARVKFMHEGALLSLLLHGVGGCRRLHFCDEAVGCWDGQTRHTQRRPHLQLTSQPVHSIAGSLHGAGGCRRLHFCDAVAQRRGFEAQLGLARHAGLPLFLHMRAAAADFMDIMRCSAAGDPGARVFCGVVHSFTGTVEELGALLALQPPLAIGALAWPHQADRTILMQSLVRQRDACMHLEGAGGSRVCQDGCALVLQARLTL